MAIKQFTYNEFGRKYTLHVGQKVQVTYYAEYPNEKESYKRTFIERLFDKPFQPVKNGIIIGDAGIHPYWMGTDRKEQYLLVRFSEYIFDKPIPISCIQDCKEAVYFAESFLANSIHKLGQPGYDMESYQGIKNQIGKAKDFIS